MGYRGKVEEQARARELREQGKTLVEIAAELGVSKASVSVWVRDIDVEIRRGQPVARRPHAQHIAKLDEIELCDRLGRERVGPLARDAFLAAGVALYAGEGTKARAVTFANTDAEMIRFFCAWLRTFFPIDESRLRVRVYLHEGLDLDAAQAHWSVVTGVPLAQFRAPYRARADPTIRRNVHEFGCAYVRYACSRTHREIMGLVRALLSSSAYSGVAQSAERRTVNP